MSQELIEKKPPPPLHFRMILGDVCVMAHSHYRGQGQGNDGFLYYAMYLSHAVCLSHRGRHLHQVYNIPFPVNQSHADDVLASNVLIETKESLQNRVATHFRATLLLSMRTISISCSYWRAIELNLMLGVNNPEGPLSQRPKANVFSENSITRTIVRDHTVFAALTPTLGLNTALVSFVRRMFHALSVCSTASKFDPGSSRGFSWPLENLTDSIIS